MPRQSAPPATPLAVVRAWLGLSQTTLATYLGLSRVQVSYVQTGRRAPGPAAPRLDRLLALVPPPWGSGPPEASAPPVPLPVVAPLAAPVALTQPATRQELRRQLRATTQAAAALRADVTARATRAATVSHQARALAALTAPDPTDNAPARTARLVEALQLEIAIATGPDAPAAPASLAHDTLRLWLLETEAATLAAWLGAEAVGAPD